MHHPPILQRITRISNSALANESSNKFTALGFFEKVCIKVMNTPNETWDCMRLCR